MVEGTKGSHHKEGTTKMAKHSMVCAGIDTGKHKLDVALDQGPEQLQVDNSPDGHTSLAAWLRQRRVRRIGIEASGGYEQAVVAALRRDGFSVILFQPAQVRAYARFILQLAKNDKIDAALIAACTAAAKTIREPPDPRLTALAGHLTMVEQITEDIAGSRPAASPAATNASGNAGKRKSPASGPWLVASSSYCSPLSVSTVTWPRGLT
jgi:transposase